MGFTEFLKLIGVLSVAASLKLREYESCTLALAIDKFLNKILTKQGFLIKPFYGE